jgi:hypothetical protein
MIASDLVQSSMRLIGALASGETPSTDEAADGLLVLQQLLDSWSADEMLVFATAKLVLTTVNGTASYTPGSRPLKILSADVVTGGNTHPVAVVGPDGWAQVPDRNASSSLPRAVYCDYAYPTALVYVAPIPNIVMSINLYATVDLATLANGAATFTMPEGYARAVRYNLAMDLAPEYGRMTAPEMANVAAIAAQTKDAIRKLVASNRAGKSALAIPPVEAA